MIETRQEPHGLYRDDLQASRYALSYIPNPNIRGYWVEAAFIALYSEKLGENVEDSFHYDFENNMFPHFKENRKTKSVFEEEDGSDEDLDKEEDALNRKSLSNLTEYIPQYILDFIIE